MRKKRLLYFCSQWPVLETKYLYT